MAEISGRHIYHMGKRFRIYRTLAYILCTVVVFGFYFIYDFLLEGTAVVTPAMLLAVFLFIEAVVLFAIYKGSGWIEKNYYYMVDRRGVTIVINKKQQVYTWDKFQAVELGMFSFVDLIPVKYTYDGRKLVFSQYLERNWEFHREIFSHIRDHVEISEELDTQVKAMSMD